ncbi:TMhelix containing protein [Vibrio phage 1.121.O._10N.286.46.C4]|nr:TMhelix containing protein [Vibrio phage 1.121.O._10N.286.46.C4]
MGCIVCAYLRKILHIYSGLVLGKSYKILNLGIDMGVVLVVFGGGNIAWCGGEVFVGGKMFVGGRIICEM